MLVARGKPPVPVTVKKAEAVQSKSPTVIVFEISAMERSAVEAVKSAIDRKARQMIGTVDVPYELDELSKQGRDELKSLQSDDVTVDIGKTDVILFAFVLCLHSD